MTKIFAGRLSRISLLNMKSHKKQINHKINTVSKVLLRTAFLLGIGFVMLYPILFIISGCFKGRVDSYDPTVIWIPKHFSLEAMKITLKTLDYTNALSRTLWILIPSVLLQMVSTVMAGYGFARFKFKERNFLFWLLIFTIVVPTQNLIIPLYGNMQSFDMFGIFKLISVITGGKLPSLIDSPAVFYVRAAFGMGIRSGLYIFIMRQFFRNMPTELEEAAKIDGCGNFRTFTRVMLPNVIPALVTVLIFSIVWYWNDYYEAIMLYRTDMPLSVRLTLLNDLLNVNQKTVTTMNDTQMAMLKDSIMECGCLLVLAPLLVMYVFLQRFFTESIERTGIVG